jgi:hypothetical protein
MCSRKNLTASDVKYIPIRTDHLLQRAMTRVFTLLKWIMGEVFFKFGVAFDRVNSCVVPLDRLHYIKCVTQAIYMANLIAVVSGYWNFFNGNTLMLQFDDDFGIKVKIISHS